MRCVRLHSDRPALLCPCCLVRRFELFVEHCAEIASAKLETAGAFFLFVVSIVVIGVVTPLTEAENGWAGIDGIYFALITFSTVGLGDLTLSWASARSLHEYFGCLRRV